MSDKWQYKVIIIGSGGSGKSTILRRYTTGLFSGGTSMTIGVDFSVTSSRTNYGTSTLQVWDFGGEERFRTMIPSFCLGSKGALLLFDPIRPQTFLELEEWIQIIRNNTVNIPIILVAGKLDLVQEGHIAAIPKQEIQDFIQKNEINTYYEVSAKTGENIVEIFTDINCLMVERWNAEALQATPNRRDADLKIPAHFIENFDPSENYTHLKEIIKSSVSHLKNISKYKDTILLEYLGSLVNSAHFPQSHSDFEGLSFLIDNYKENRSEFNNTILSTCLLLNTLGHIELKSLKIGEKLLDTTENLFLSKSNLAEIFFIFTTAWHSLNDYSFFMRYLQQDNNILRQITKLIQDSFENKRNQQNITQFFKVGISFMLAIESEYYTLESLEILENYINRYSGESKIHQYIFEKIQECYDDLKIKIKDFGIYSSRIFPEYPTHSNAILYYITVNNHSTKKKKATIQLSASNTELSIQQKQIILPKESSSEVSFLIGRPKNYGEVLIETQIKYRSNLIAQKFSKYFIPNPSEYLSIKKIRGPKDKIAEDDSLDYELRIQNSKNESLQGKITIDINNSKPLEKVKEFKIKANTIKQIQFHLGKSHSTGKMKLTFSVFTSKSEILVDQKEIELTIKRSWKKLFSKGAKTLASKAVDKIF